MTVKQILIIASCLLLATKAVPYPNLEGQLQASQIPYCLNQLGYKCLVCGPTRDTNNTALIVPTAPNALLTACLPSKNGCVKFMDMVGQVCDPSMGCSCGYSLNATGFCVNATIPNCFQLDSTGQFCSQCVQPMSTYNYGGGKNDYGLSNDMTSCIDNVANGTPNCLQYQPQNIQCGSCQGGYYLTAALQCILPATGITVSPNCLFITSDGTSCDTCQRGYNKNVNGGCDWNGISNVLSQPLRCIRYGFDAAGVNLDYSNCLQCVPGYFLKQNGACTQAQATFMTQSESIEASSGNYNNHRDACAYSYHIDQGLEVCLLWKSDVSVNSFYFNYPATPTQFPYNGCPDFDFSAFKCKVMNACSNSYYDTNRNTCVTNECGMNGCLIGTTAICTQCQQGWNLINGHCYNLPKNVDQKCWQWDPVSFQCNMCQDWYTFNSNGVCTSVNTMFCLTFTGGVCTSCPTNMVLNSAASDCTWNLPTVFGGIFGCKTYSADLMCTACMNNFVLSSNSLSCVFQSPPNSYCAQLDPVLGTCLLCNSINYYRKIDVYGNIVCTQDTLNSYCDTSMDGCHCLTCKPGFTLATDGSAKCIFPNSLNPVTAIPGCIKYTSVTACAVCQTGSYILAADNTCYDLRFPGFTTTNSLELCLTATNAHQCATCAPYTALMTLTTTTLKNPRTFCIGPSDTLHIPNTMTTSGNLITATGIKYCQSFANDNIGSTCGVCMDGFPISGNSQMCTSATEILLSTNCLTYSVSTNQCSQCITGFYLNPLTFACVSLDNVSPACQTFNYSTSKCTACLTGYILDPNGSCQDPLLLDNSNECSNTGWLNSGSTCFSTAVTFSNAAGSADVSVVSACTVGSRLNATTKSCEVDPTVQTNCQTVDPNYGICQQCQTGYFLHLGWTNDDNNPPNTYLPTKAGMNLYNCLPAVSGCIYYDNWNAYCTTCGPTADGLARIPDDAGMVCLTESQIIPNCAIYNPADFTCVQCRANTGTIANNCQIPIQNCDPAQYNSASQTCGGCLSGFTLNSQGLCVVNHVANCQVPYDSYLCAECQTGYTLIPTKNNPISAAFGLCVVMQIEGCHTANQDNTQCLRCYPTYYAMIDGACYHNDGSSQFPYNCIHYAYNQTGRSLYCDECDQGFGITMNNTRCLMNSGGCVDSVNQDCAVYNSLAGFQVFNNCTTTSRPTSANTSFLSIAIIAILSIILAF